jgi:hypothetical protein
MLCKKFGKICSNITMVEVQTWTPLENITMWQQFWPLVMCFPLFHKNKHHFLGLQIQQSTTLIKFTNIIIEGATTMMSIPWKSKCCSFGVRTGNFMAFSHYMDSTTIEAPSIPKVEVVNSCSTTFVVTNSLT